MPAAQWLYSAFDILSSKRLFIDGRPQAIQISEIVAYADFEEIADKTLRDDLMYMVGKLDAIYLDFHLKKRQTVNKAPKPPRPRR